MFTEQGPFRVNENYTLYVNNYSWVNAANMIFIEQPSGVGFSYSDTKSDYRTGDAKAAQDNYEFIKQWLTVFDNYQSNDFYITSESYGGQLSHIPPNTKTRNQTKNEEISLHFDFFCFFSGKRFSMLFFFLFFVLFYSQHNSYMPTLAKEITEGISNGDKPKVNFKGLFVGNPYTDPVENAKGFVFTI